MKPGAAIAAGGALDARITRKSKTIRRGLAPHLARSARRALDRASTQTSRWPIAAALRAAPAGPDLDAIERRAKYLLVHTPRRQCCLHLGMSGSLRASARSHAARHTRPHRLASRFGPCRATPTTRCRHRQLWQRPPRAARAARGTRPPKPLSLRPTPDHLSAAVARPQERREAVSMDQKIVVGVGNIYAAEAAVRRGYPSRARGRARSRSRYRELALAVKHILEYAIRRGGTTLTRFHQSDGLPGYFRAGAVRLRPHWRTLQELLDSQSARSPLGQRSTFFCPHCQH